ncbi:HNH endonuclease [Nocardia amikacinitolerans]|uniref:HNH endonuclease n=1 Tax=Nocardia amikacinitolerans TaxID=756689 RepID=UPI0020A59CB1|nr:HNH endonuclease [Nocardia amikacinitolerans]MCP2280766.1 5-methylcytosine-specific restriction enzyme A [Nocardia amikacinitolerans]
MVSDPAWTRDELILACDLMMANSWRQVRETDQRAAALSKLLNLLPIHPLESRSPKFRSPGSVSRKTANIETVHPDYKGGKTRGSRLDGEVLADFLSAPEEMHAVADAIRSGVTEGEFSSSASVTIAVDIAFPEGLEYREGRLLAARYFRRERDRRARDRKIADYLTTHDRVRCEICGFDFEEFYGPRGHGYIECHHVVPLHVSGETRTKLGDLILVCSNCHRMIHYGREWLHPDELRGLLSGRVQSVMKES